MLGGPEEKIPFSKRMARAEFWCTVAHTRPNCFQALAGAPTTAFEPLRGSFDAALRIVLGTKRIRAFSKGAEADEPVSFHAMRHLEETKGRSEGSKVWADYLVALDGWQATWNLPGNWIDALATQQVWWWCRHPAMKDAGTSVLRPCFEEPTSGQLHLYCDVPGAREPADRDMPPGSVWHVLPQIQLGSVRHRRVEPIDSQIADSEILPFCFQEEGWRIHTGEPRGEAAKRLEAAFKRARQQHLDDVQRTITGWEQFAQHAFKHLVCRIVPEQAGEAPHSLSDIDGYPQNSQIQKPTSRLAKYIDIRIVGGRPGRPPKVNE